MLCDFPNAMWFSWLRAFANNVRFTLLNRILWNWEFYWQTGGGVHQAPPLCGARARTECLCARKSGFSPPDRLWKLELEHSIYLFTNGKCGTCWDKAIRKVGGMSSNSFWDEAIPFLLANTTSQEENSSGWHFPADTLRRQGRPLQTSPPALSPACPICPKTLPNVLKSLQFGTNISAAPQLVVIFSCAILWAPRWHTCVKVNRENLLAM